MSSNELNDVKPTSIAHIVPLNRSASPWMPLCRCEEVRFACFRGWQSALAQVIAQEMASDFHEILGQSINSIADLNALLLGANDKDVVHIDECHELLRPFQTALYLAVDQRRLFLQNGRKSRIPQSMPLADFTLLLSTTDEYCLLQPLRDRMRLVLRFEFYTSEELTVLLRQRHHALQWDVDEEVFPAGRTTIPRNTSPGFAASAICPSCISGGRLAVATVDHLQRHLWVGADRQSWAWSNRTEVPEIDCRRGKPPERDRIDARPAVRTVSQVSEPFLLRAGLVTKDDQGRRQLTAAGREHLSNLRQHVV